MAYNTGTDPTLAELITAKFVPEVFTSDVMMHTMSELVVGGRVKTKMKDTLKKGYVYDFPLMAEGSDAEVTPGTKLTPSDLLGTAPTITIDQWRGVAAEISDFAEAEDPIGYLKEAAISLSYTIHKRVDTKLGSLFSSLAAGSVYGDDGQTFSAAIFQKLQETLDENDVPSDDRSLIGDSSMKADFWDIDKFIHKDYVNNPALPTGMFGELYGVNVFFTNNLTAAATGNYGVLMHRDALGLIMQKAPRSQLIPMPEEFRTILQVDVMFGVGELRDTFGKSFYTRKK